MYAPKSTGSAKGSLAGGANALEASGSSSGGVFNNNPLRNTVIGLGTATGVLLFVVVGLLVAMARRGRRRSDTRGTTFVPEARGYPYALPYDDHHARKSTDKL